MDSDLGFFICDMILRIMMIVILVIVVMWVD